MHVSEFQCGVTWSVTMRRDSCGSSRDIGLRMAKVYGCQNYQIGLVP